MHSSEVSNFLCKPPTVSVKKIITVDAVLNNISLSGSTGIRLDRNLALLFLSQKKSGLKTLQKVNLFFFLVWGHWREKSVPLLWWACNESSFSGKFPSFSTFLRSNCFGTNFWHNISQKYLNKCMIFVQINLGRTRDMNSISNMPIQERFNFALRHLYTNK